MELVINFSGGKDSCAMLTYLVVNYPNVKKHVVFADTGFEHRGVIEWCRKRAADWGLPLHVVRNPNKTFLSMSEKRGKFPGMQQRQCTSDLKRGPIQTWIRQNIQDPVVINAMGLRADESPARAKKSRLVRDKVMTNSKRTVWNWLPIHSWATEEVYEYHRYMNIPLHPVYKYLKRFSCRICIFMNDSDLKAVAKNDPEAIQLVAGIESRIGFTMFQRGKLIDLIN